MNYIFAHGTVNGYKICYPNNVPQGVDAAKLDVRYSVDQSNDRLSRSAGYAFQMFSGGVLISTIKLFEDGERAGGGKGFFAFSVFVPNGKHIPGKQLKSILDSMMISYCNQLPNSYATCNQRIDWSFVDSAEKEIENAITTTQQPFVTAVATTDSYAYIDVRKEDFEKYLNEPFQGCYYRYRLVFLGETLISDSQKELYIPLKIDFSNTNYKIIWNGDSSKYNNLPHEVNSSEIGSGSHTFRVNNYVDQIVFYKDGLLDAKKHTLTLNIPDLKPIELKIIVSITPSELANNVLLIYDYSVKQLTKDESSYYVVFRGDEIDKEWKPVLKPESNNYKLESPSSIKPRDLIGSEINIQFTKIKFVKLQIFEGDDNDITANCNEVGLSVKYGEISILPSFEEGKLVYGIEEKLNFDDLQFSVGEQYKMKQDKPGKLGDDLYRLYLVKREKGDTNYVQDSEELKNDSFLSKVRQYFNRVVVDKKMIAILAGTVLLVGVGLYGFIYWQKKNEEQKQLISDAEEYLKKDEMLLDSLRYYQKPLDTNSELYKKYEQYIDAREFIDKDGNKIFPSSLLSDGDRTFVDTLLANEEKLKYLRAYYSDYIQSTSWNKLRDQLGEYVPPRFSVYDELSNLLAKQKNDWNYAAIDGTLRPITNDTIKKWKNNQSDLYEIYKKLDWLRGTRKLINSLNAKEYNNLTDYYKEGKIKEKYKDYVDEDIKVFLDYQMEGENKKNQLINAGSDCENFESLTFQEIKDLVNFEENIKKQKEEDAVHNRAFETEPTASESNAGGKDKQSGKRRTSNKDY